MNKARLKKIKRAISDFKKARILVIGDLILDEYLWGTVSRISPEAPVPVVWVKNEGYMPGGAGNVANNIVSLGGKASIVGVIGSDANGRKLKEALQFKGIDTSGIALDHTRPTTTKTRVVAHHQQVVRIDKELQDPVAKDILDVLIDRARAMIGFHDAVIIEDYGKGVITSGLLKRILPLAKKHNKIVAVDPKEAHFGYYKNTTLITPNTSEAENASGVKIKDDTSLYKAGERILNRLNCKIVIITLGEHGMCVFQKGKPPQKIPTVAREVFDVSGAGDTVIATYTLSYASGLDPFESATLANCAAGIVVGKLGTATTSSKELLNGLERLDEISI